MLTVYDGDTLACDLDGNGHLDAPNDKIRLLGIDAPEMSYSRKNHTGHDQPFAAEAKAVLAQYIGKPVYLVFDVKRVDRYGRTLAFVYPSPTATMSLNERLVSQGLARLMFLPPNIAQEGLLLQAAVSARLKQIGLWKPVP